MKLMNLLNYIVILGSSASDVPNGWNNLGLFRVYLSAYFMNNLKIRQDMPCWVRQLSPIKDGVPIEIYVFTSEIERESFINVQAELFDHVLAAMRIFGLCTVLTISKSRR